MHLASTISKPALICMLLTAGCVPVVDALPSGSAPTECDHVRAMAGSVIALRQGSYPRSDVSLEVSGDIPTAPLYRSMVDDAWQTSPPPAREQAQQQRAAFVLKYGQACEVILKSAKNSI